MIDKNDIVGLKFNRWTVLEFIRTEKRINSSGLKHWYRCQCDCGTIREQERCHLRAKTGKNISCGCYNIEQSNNNSLPNNEGTLNRILTYYKSNKRLKGLTMELTLEEFKSLIYQNCYYCGVEPRNLQKNNNPKKPGIYYNGIDRKDNDIGYILNNCVPCCKRCNFMKQDIHHDEFIKHIHQISAFIKAKES